MNENALKDIFSSHSSEIYSDSIAVKHTDKSTFLHHGTGIPLGIKPFFSIEKIKEGEKVFVSLLPNLIEYGVYFVLANNRTRLFWKSDF